MILDFIESTRSFTLRVLRAEAEQVRELMTEHGLDFSQPASTSTTAVLFTREPFAAASFYRYATPNAIVQLKGIIDEVQSSQAPDATDNLRIQCPADKELWPFQKANIQYALRRKHVLIGDQPGLGKTPTAICFANEIQAKRVLVICPANIRLQWYRRIQEWSTMPWGYSIHPILSSKNGTNPLANWTLVSYDLARTAAIGRALARERFDLLILDEAHYLKESTSNRTRAVFGGGRDREFDPIASRCERVMALTGTPLPNRPREAYTLARGLCHDAIDWASEDSFKERFNPSLRREIITPSGEKKMYIDERSGRHFELQNRLRYYFMARHMKREVMTQLKMPVYDIVHAEEDALVKQALQAESLLDIDPENLEGADAEALGHVAVVRRQMGVALAPQAADYVKMLIDGGEEKIVLFAWHIEVLNILQEKLAKFGVLRIDGSTSAKRKEAIVQQYIREPDKHVILGNIQSMGTGTDGLQLVSNHAVIAEASWTPGENIQCFDRLDRGGQTRTVQGDIIVAPGSFSEKVLASALRKNQVIDRALDRRI